MRQLASLARVHRDPADGPGNLQAQPLLARLVIRGMLDEGSSEEAIADALGLAPEQVRALVRSARER